MTLREKAKTQASPNVVAMRHRIQALYRQNNTTQAAPDVINAAFEELALALDVLQTADETLHAQRETWQNSYSEKEVEIQRYKDLFEHAPIGYVVTSIDGTIRQANTHAMRMLDCNERLLIGRSLALFVPDGQRRAFRSVIAQLPQADAPHDWALGLQTWQNAAFDAGLVVGVMRSASGHPLALYWLIRELNVPAQLPAAPNAPEQVMRDTVAQSQFAFMAEVSLLLSSGQDVDATLAQVARLAVPAIADGCIIDFADSQRAEIRQLVVVRDPCEHSQSYLFQRSYTPTVAARQSVPAPDRRSYISAPEPLLEQLPADTDIRTVLRALKPKSALVTPLNDGAQAPLGTLSLLLADADRIYGPNELALAEELAHRIATAVEHAR